MDKDVTWKEVEVPPVIYSYVDIRQYLRNIIKNNENIEDNMRNRH